MKKYFILFGLLIIFVNTKLLSTLGGGLGTSVSPYQILNEHHLKELSDSVYIDAFRSPNDCWHCDKYFELIQEIDNMTDYISWFYGHFYGNSNKITINGEIGVFGTLDNGGIIEGLIADGYSNYAGIVVSLVRWSIVPKPIPIVSNCTSNVNITVPLGTDPWGRPQAVPGGGITATNGGTVLNCVNNGSVIGVNIIGGIVGENLRQVTNCVNNGRITATNSGSNTNILGQPTVANGVGGIIGTGYANSNNINLGTVEGQGMVGGIIGVTNGPPGGPTTPITNNFNYGFVKGTNRVGGVVGWVATGGVNISNNSNFGVVVGEEDTGCIVGKNSGGNISNNHYDKQMCGE